jgi:ParB family chromosome partitioning protein
MIDSIIGQKLSVRDAENMIKNYKDDNSTQSKKSTKISLLDEYQDALKEALPFKHKVKSKSVEISFNSREEIENFLAILKKVQ